MRCIVFVERVITAVVIQALLSEFLPIHTNWKPKYIAGINSGMQSQTRKNQNEIVEEFRNGMVCSFLSQNHQYELSLTVFPISMFDLEIAYVSGEHHCGNFYS